MNTRNNVYFYQIEGTKEGVDMRATQIEESSNNLRDDNVAILETPDKAYLWIGKVNKKHLNPFVVA